MSVRTGDASEQALRRFMFQGKISICYASELKNYCLCVEKKKPNQPLQTKPREVIQMGNNSLAHTELNCKYHIILTSKVHQE